ncbi:hypothetical protein [Pseudolysinimonas sp.]|nr:hypothetical protein [Pseudolysinimonas sp.]
MSQQKWLLDGPKTIEIDGIRKLKVGLWSVRVWRVSDGKPPLPPASAE